jgi:predicted Holliday junction resolvase-like endonuclease
MLVAVLPLFLGMLACIIGLLLRGEDLKRALAEERQKKSPIVTTQRAVLRGQLAEQVAPLLPNFPYHPSDFRPLGQPIDFIVFDGLADAREHGGPVRGIIIGDIKSGNAHLSDCQEAIKEAIEQGHVRWETIRIDDQFRIRRRRA